MSLLKNFSASARRKSSIPSTDQPVFLSRLGELRQNGYPLKQSIEFLLIQQQKHVSFDQQQVIDDLSNGGSISEGLKKLGFPPFVCFHLHFAERYGDIDETLIETASLLEQRQREKKQFTQVMHYPLFLLVLFTVILAMLQFFMLPRFAVLYDTMPQSETSLVTILQSLLFQLPVYGGIAVCFFMLAAAAGWVGLNRMEPHRKWTILAGIPLVGFYVRHYHSYTFSREAAHLLKGGLSMNAMLDLFIEQPYRGLYRSMAEFMKDELLRGESIYATVCQFPYVTDAFQEITAHGEENGQLAKEWSFYSRYCLASLEKRTTRILSLVQPILFSILGLAVIGAYLLIFLPMFQLMQTI